MSELFAPKAETEFTDFATTREMPAAPTEGSLPTTNQHRTELRSIHDTSNHYSLGLERHAGG